MHPHTIRDPPPNFRVPPTSLSLNPSPAFFPADFLPSDPSLLTLVSTDHTTLFQSSTVQCWCSRAKSILSFLCLCERSGFFFLTTAFIPAFFRLLCTVWAEGLVDDVGKGFGDINSSRSLSRTDKMDCMMNIGGGKYRRMTSN